MLPVRPHREEVGVAPSKLRIAWTTRSPSGQKIGPECEKCVYETVLSREEQGHALVEDRPVYDWDKFLDKVHVVWTAFIALSVDGLSAMFSRKPGLHTLEAVTLACYARTATARQQWSC